MEKIWLKSYPPDVAPELDYKGYSTLVELMEDSLKQYANRSAFICMGKSLSYKELDEKSIQLGAYLQGLGLAKGARVAIMLPNVLQYPVAMMAVLRAGYTVVNVNPLYTARELEHQLIDSGAEAIIVLENFASVVQQVLPKTQIKHIIVGTMGDMLGIKGLIVNFVVRKVKKLVPSWHLPNAVGFNTAMQEGSRKTFKKVPIEKEDIAFLQYTGGTTGVAKGAVLLQRNVLANVLQSETWLLSGLKNEKIDQLNIVCALPLYHIFALTACALMGMRVGGCNLLIPNPRDIKGFIKELQTFKMHLFPAVNTLYNALANDPEFAKLDFSNLKVSNGGGMAAQKAVSDKWKAITGRPIVEGYGLSETSPVATVGMPMASEFTGNIGVPVPSTDIAIRDDNGNDVPLGQAGEICIRGPQVMAGYWNRPDETAKVMTPDGFFKSGDIGIMDENGFTKIVDRKKDMILVSGFNVFPNEIEAVIASHPGVLEVAAVGVADEHSGEAVKLFVVKKDPNLTEEDLKAFCKTEFTGYKRPKYIEFRADLPKTNVGKILRRELRDTPATK